MIDIEINDAAITAALTAAAGRLDDLTPVMELIGRMLVTSTKKRFGEGVSPSGVTWAPNSPVTLARKKETRPLFAEGELSSQISTNAGADFVEVGSNRVYAAMMQFGGTKAAFPHLWGDIPARPFLGLSEADERNILDEISEALGTAFAA